MKLKKTTLSAVLEHFDLKPSDFGSAVARASDGYAIEISEDMLWQKDVMLVFEADDRRLSLRVYVRRERAMYCVRDVVSLTLLPRAVAVPVESVLFFDTAVKAMKKEPYAAYDEEAEAIKASDFLDGYFEEKPEFIRAEMIDGLVKREQYSVFSKGFLKLTGKNAVQFTAPDLPAGMRMKGIQTLHIGKEVSVSLKMAFEKSECSELPGKDFLEDILPETDCLKLTGSDNTLVEIERQDVLEARFYQETDGAVSCEINGKVYKNILRLDSGRERPKASDRSDLPSGKKLVMRLEPSSQIEPFGVIDGEASELYTPGVLYQKAGTLMFYPQWDETGGLCAVVPGTTLTDGAFTEGAGRSHAVGKDGGMFNIGSNPIELRGNTVFGRRLDGSLFEMAGLFVNEPETTVMSTAWDALECLKNHEKIMIIELDGFGLNIYRKALSSGKLPFLSSHPMRPAMTVFRPVSHSGLAAMLTGTTPDVNGIHNRKGRTLLMPDVFERCMAMGKECAYIEGYSKLINTSEEPVLNPSRGGTTTDKAVFESALKAAEKQPDLLFIHFHGIDDDATTYGPYASETMERVLKNDIMVSRLAEEWTGSIIVTADHGLHEETGYDSRGSHGIFCAEDMLVPYIYIKKDTTE
ncbi:alkaline phosphatase family protein [Eubacterium callanderi]|uniref:alkaline phosphatase family protein n=1 Tax=Eubacterium callanderi TaxID=53442 RepID=UPI003983DBBB